MALLSASDKDLFDGFIDWRRQAAGHISNNMVGIVHLVLFGSFGDKTIHDSWSICRKDECKKCDMYQADRCHAYVKSKYAGRPNTMREVMKNNYARGDYEFYKKGVVGNIDSRDITQLTLIVGSYRLELFKEEMYNKAIASAKHHNRINKDNQINVFKEKDPKYYSMEYIQENDFWSMYKETQLEGDLLCSILSDF